MSAHPARATVLLTGGIGSGKSAVGRLLAEWGALVVDADVLAREAVAPGSPGLAAVVAAFGPEVLAPDGSLDRAALADVVFGDPERLAVLEGIVHPLVEALSAERLRAARPGQLVVYEVPLPDRVVSEGQLVVVVDAPESLRRARLRSRGLSDEQVAVRMARQPTRAEWLSLADAVVDNSGDLDDLARHVAALWQRLTGVEAPVGGSD